MRREDIGPRHFGGQLGYEHAVLLERPEQWLMIAGHESRADDGSIAHRGDVRAQLGLTFQRIRETLAEAGFTLADVVQLRVHAIDIRAVTANYDVVTAILAAHDCRPTSTLVQVAGLSDPDMLVEVEGVAAR